MALVVGNGQDTRGFVAGLGVALVGHHVVAGQERHLLEDFLQRLVVVDEGVDGVHILESVVRILLVEVFAFDVEAACLIVGADVVGAHPYVFGLDALHTQGEVQSFGGQDDGLGRVVHLLVPHLLVGQSCAVVESSFQFDGQGCGQFVAQSKAHVAHVAHLLGDERTVGEVLLVG